MSSMSGLGQFDAGYNSAQDRILLRITNTAGEEYRLWLTRRFCFSMLGDFKVKVSACRLPAEEEERVVDSSSAVSGSAGSAPVMQADIQQELVASQQDFGQAFRPGEQFPLGEQGELVERVDLTQVLTAFVESGADMRKLHGRAWPPSTSRIQPATLSRK